MTPFAARAVSCLFAAATVFLTYLLAQYLIRERPPDFKTRSDAPGILSAAILSTCYGFHRLALDARVDMTFSFFVVLSMYALLRRAPELLSHGAKALSADDIWLFWLSCTFAMLSKGPLGIVLSFICVLAALSAMTGFVAALRLMCRPSWAWLAPAVTALSWYFAAYAGYGPEVIEKQLLFENVLRFFGGEAVNRESFLFYIPSFVIGAFPWSLILFLAPFIAGGRVSSAVLRYFAVGVIFFSLASGKRHAYLAPLYPAFSVFAASIIILFIQRTDPAFRHRVWRSTGSLPSALCAAVFSLALIIEALAIFPATADIIVLESMRWLNLHGSTLQIFLLLIIMLTYIISTRGAEKLPWRIAAAWVPMLGLLTAAIVVGLGLKNNLKGFKATADVINNITGSAAKLIIVKEKRDEYFDPLRYYLSREIAVRSSAEPILDSCGGFVLARKGGLYALVANSERGGVSIETVAEFNQLHDANKGDDERAIVLLRFTSSLFPISSVSPSAAGRAESISCRPEAPLSP